MTSTRSTEVRLRSRPIGLPSKSDFEIASIDVGTPATGEVIVKNVFMSVDPYMRGRMIDRKSYLAPFELGKPMLGSAVGIVFESNDPNYNKGEWVTSMLGWREFARAAAAEFQKIDTRLGEPSSFLNVLGTVGLTAYAGLFKVAELAAGETLFVSAAAGAVGSVVCQLAKARGASVIGSAGSDEKCRWLIDVAGIDHAINYRKENIIAALQNAAPHGIDVYFDNVGGAHLEAAIDCMKQSGRIAMCGMIEQYNDTSPRPGPSNLGMSIGKTLHLQGFLVSRFFSIWPEVRAELSELVKNGKIKVEETIITGIEEAPDALLRLFSGDKMGKVLVKLG